MESIFRCLAQHDLDRSQSNNHGGYIAEVHSSVIVRTAPVVNKTKQALRSMVNGKTMGPDELPVKLPKLGLFDSSYDILLAFYGIIVAGWMTGGVLLEWRNNTIKVPHKKKDQTEYGNYRGLSVAAYAGEVLLKLVASRLGDFNDEAGVLPEEQCGFRSQRSTANKRQSCAECRNRDGPATLI